jgi:hypothetical protein
MGNQLAAALDMARRGFRVFPCVPYGKKPAIDDWTSLATTDEAQIRAWFNEGRDYNYGVLTTDLVVADVDVSKIGREAALANYAEIGGHFDTFVVQTPTEGLHAYFAGPDSGLRVGLVPGVDIRSHNGYVVGPGCYTDPARTDDNSVKAVGHYTIVRDLELEWVPPPIEMRLRPPGIRRENVDFSVELDTPTAISNAYVWLLAAPAATMGGGGDELTYKTAAKLVRDFALSPEKAFELMCGEWNERCQPHPWPPELLWVKVRNAADYGTAPLGGARPEATFGTVTVPEVPLQWYQQPVHEHGVYLGNALDANTLEARRWLAERLFMRGDVTVMAAAGAAGKSITSLTIAAHFAVGKDYGPYKLKSQGKAQRIFIYNAEDDIAEQTRRLLAICATYKLDYEAVRANLMLMDDSLGDLILATAERNVAHEHTAMVNFIIELLTQNEIDIGIFDPLINLHQCSENDNVQMRFVIGVLRKIARKANAAVLVAHHVGKGNTKEAGDADAIRGAGAIINSARIAIMLSGPTDKDLPLLGIDTTLRYSYVRMDDAKANLYLKTGIAIMWTKWFSVRIATNDLVGVPVALDVDVSRENERRRIGEIIYREMVIAGTATTIVADAIRWLRAEDEMYNTMCEKNDTALRRLIQTHLARPLEVEPNVQLILTGAAGKPVIQIM